MKKKFSIPMLSLLLAICGFAAWGASEAMNRITPAEGPKVVSTTPEAGTTVEELPNFILVTFDMDIARPMEVPDVTLVNELGNVVYTWEGWTGQVYFPYDNAQIKGNMIGLPKPKNLSLSDGEYTVKLPAALVANNVDDIAGDLTNTVFEFTFKLEAPAAEGIVLVSSEPANNSTVENLSNGIMLTYGSNVFVNTPFSQSGKMPYLVNAAGEIVYTWPDTSVIYGTNSTYKTSWNNVFLKAPDAIPAGTYTLVLPAGMVEDGDSVLPPSEAAEVKFTTTADTGEVVTPPDPEPETFALIESVPENNQTVSSLTKVIFTFDTPLSEFLNINMDFKGVPGAIVNATTGTAVATINLDDLTFTYPLTDPDNPGGWMENNQYGYFLTTPIEEAGTYTITLAEGVVKCGDKVNEAVEFTVIVGPTETPSAPQVVIADCFPTEGQVFEKPEDVSLRIVFDQPVELVTSNTAGRIMVSGTGDNKWNRNFTTSTPITIDPENPNAVLVAAEAFNSSSQWNYSNMIDGVYNLIIFDNLVTANGVPNDRVDMTFEIKGTEPPAVQAVVPEINFPTDNVIATVNEGDNGVYEATATFNYKDVGNINFANIAVGTWTLNVTSIPVTNTETGEVKNIEVKNFLNSAYMMMLGLESWDWGTYTWTLPAGMWTKDGGSSAEVKCTLELKDPAAVVLPEFEITRCDFFDTPGIIQALEGTPNGAPFTMMYRLISTVEGGENMLDWESNPKKIAALNDNRAFVFETSLDEYIVCFTADIYKLDANGNRTGEVIHTWVQDCLQEIYGYGTYRKDYVGTTSSNVAFEHPILALGGDETTCKLEDGQKYRLSIYFYDGFGKIPMDNSEHAMAIGRYSFDIEGGAEAYNFSDITLDTVNGESAATTDEDPYVRVNGITDPTAPISFTFSGPVAMTAALNLGMGATQNLNATPVDPETIDGVTYATTWSVVPGASAVADPEGGYLPSFDIIISAKDQDGLVLHGPQGVESSSCWMVNCEFLGMGVDLTVTPGEGTLESLKEFTVTAANGGTFAIADSGDIENPTPMPYLESASGSKIADTEVTLNGTSATLTLPEAVTSAGVYYLVIPVKTFSLGTGYVNNPITVEYTINGTPDDAVCTIATDATIHELGIAGFRVNNVVTVDSRANISLFKGEDRVVAKPVQTAINNGSTILFADFSTDGQPLVLEGGEEYSLFIPANMVAIEGTEFVYDEMESGFTAATSGAAEFVALSTNINGLGTTTSMVAKGEVVNVTLTPADNWLVKTVEFNGTDVTDDVVNLVYTTEPLEADSELNVLYEYMGAVIVGTNDINEDLGSLKLNVWSNNGAINVKGLGEGMIVTLYTINGLEMAKTVANANEISFEKVEAGTYLIVVSNGTTTEAVKLQHK